MKISIIGMGRVGSTLAFSLLLKGLADELVLVDKNREIAEGEALDLEHAEAFTGHPIIVRAGDLFDTAGSDIIVLTCSVPWNDTYTTRFDIGKDNLAMYREIIPPLAKASPEAKLLVISNPVDVMTFHALKLSGFGPEQVFGTGTLIDSARFRTMLSGEMNIHPDDLRAYIFGEHGDSQFAVFSMAMAGGMRITDNEITHDIFNKASRSGWDVINRKGHTNFAISMAAALVIEAVAWDTKRTMPLSVLVDNYLGESDICLSLPVVLGKTGVLQVLELELGEEETEAFHKSAEVVREAIKQSTE
ncbi:malate dehydrogenase [Planctomycetota bacterium]